MELDLIYTEDEMLISRQHREWKEWQVKFETYKASLSFQSTEELTEFLITEYNLTWLSKTKLANDINQINSDLVVLDLPKDKAGSLNFKELNAETSL